LQVLQRSSVAAEIYAVAVATFFTFLGRRDRKPRSWYWLKLAPQHLTTLRPEQSLVDVHDSPINAVRIRLETQRPFILEIIALAMPTPAALR